MKNMLAAAQAAKMEIAQLTTEQKNKALLAMAQALLNNSEAILTANAMDMAAAKGTVSDVMLDRLQLTQARIEGMASGIRQVAELPDPVGNVLEEYTRSDGLVIQKTSVPIGVIAIIYESRPNVTSDAAALTLKSGNVCVLRGGKEAYRSSERCGTDDRTRLCGSSDPQRRRGSYQYLSEAGNGSLYRYRHGHLPCVCGKDC